ncbi:DUF3592 domain-containing protein [Actinomadura bangladeshensis]|uniref:DUF3592 domain-containing protein n=1 Tax=Actinomadura bangladeshensis TaxID=453573 RepID=A0A4R4PAK5_9ACTN|nr:DUF3592 domain-containing protein [Actinomadura bangladeshensis]TDC18090.1 hypothetical protein E1284_07145 [Actinomadura bangladeshensis]
MIALALVVVTMTAVAVLAAITSVVLFTWDQPPGKATGRVLGAAGNTASKDYLVIEFTTADGRVIRFHGLRDEWRKADGSQVHIRYDPRDPHGSAEQEFGIWPLLVTTLLTAATASAAVVAARAVVRQRRRPGPGR